MTKTIFTLAGMHRSGTSLCASWMDASGINVGKSLLGPASSNPKGHFEDEEILNIHREDLRAKGLRISGLVLKGQTKFNLEVNSKKEIQSLLKSRADIEVWGWKEPRTCLYLEDWKSLLPELKIIAVFRHPDNVINSLYKRLKNGYWYDTNNPFRKLYWYLSIDKNPKKWFNEFSKTYAVYNQQIIDFHKKYPSDSLILDLDELTSNSHEIGKRITSFLGIETQMSDFNHLIDKKLLTKKEEVKNISSDEATRIYQDLKSIAQSGQKN